MKKKILIALNEKIEKEINEDIEIVSKDIQYKEGILEILELNKNINYILFSENLIGQIEIKKLIKKIFLINENINIYLIVKNKKNFIKNNREIINNKNLIIIENLEDIRLNNLFKENKLENIEIKKENIKNKIISISGTGGVGKSITTLKIAKYLEKKNKNILIIDLDILNKPIKLILNINTNKDEIVKVNKNIDLLETNKIDYINKIISENKEKYEYILIDTSNEISFDISEKILKNAYKNIFIVEPNLLGIKKSNTLLDIYINEWKVNKEKIFILFNKYNKYSIKYEIIKNVFYKFKIIGKIKLNQKYDLVINKNKLNYLIIENKSNKIIKKINFKINKIKGDKILWK